MKKVWSFLVTLVLFVTFFIFGTISISAAETDISKESEITSTAESVAQNENGDNGINSETNLHINTEDSEEAELNSILPDNTTVEVTLSWAEVNDANSNNENSNSANHPLVYTKVEAYRIDEITNQVKINLFEGFTDINGKFTFSFRNAMDGNCDVYIVVYAQGTDVSTYNASGDLYSLTFLDSSFEDLSSGNYSKEVTISNALISDSIDGSNLFLQALEISQYAIYASMYYEYLKGDDVEDVSIICPHNKDWDNTFYSFSSQTIYVEGSHSDSSGNRNILYSCDVITHEYGHHFANNEGLDNGSHSWHSGDMAEHYKSHFCSTTSSDPNSCSNKCALLYGNQNGNAFLESECKEKGCQIAWNEALATLFGELSQQHFANQYIAEGDTNITNFADAIYSSDNGASEGIENRLAKGKESIEWTVINVLYDIYDEYTDAEKLFDLISIEDTTMWEYVSESNAATLFEFIEYIKECDLSSNVLPNLGKILGQHELTVTRIDSYTMSSSLLEIKFSWREATDSDYYTARQFQINFYDSEYFYIGSTAVQSVVFNSNYKGVLTIDGQLWENIMNCGTECYCSITVYECDGNVNNYGNNSYYVTRYESGYFYIDLKGHYTFLSMDDTPITHNFSTDNCNWYRFIVPSTGQYIFETSGDTDTFMEIYTKFVVGTPLDYLLVSDDNSGEAGNSRIVINLNASEVIHIRIRKNDWSMVGVYSFSISINHVHSYTYDYVSINKNSHWSYCSCGDRITEGHTYISIPTGHRCKFCSHFEKYVMIPTASITLPIIDNSTEVMYNEDEDI